MFLNDWAIKAIKKYQKNKAIIGTGRCKHSPSCSHYAIACYQKFHFIKASLLTVYRILRCNPLAHKVYDPVPLTKDEKKQKQHQSAMIAQIIPLLLEHQAKYPKMQIADYVKLIYQYSFGECMINDTKHIANTTPNESEILNETYQRVPISSHDSYPQSEISADETVYFYDRLYLLKQLIKKQIIPLEKTISLHWLNAYIDAELAEVTHSQTYIQAYAPSYIVCHIQK